MNRTVKVLSTNELTLSKSMPSHLVESARWTRISRYESTFLANGINMLLCIHINLTWCMLLLPLLQHGAMLIVFSYVLLHVFRLVSARAPKHSPNVRTYAATPPISTDLSLWKIKLIFMIRFFLVLILSSARSLCLSFCLFIYVYLFLFSPSHWIKILSSSLNYGTNKYTEQLQSFYCCFFYYFTLAVFDLFDASQTTTWKIYKGNCKKEQRKRHSDSEILKSWRQTLLSNDCLHSFCLSICWISCLSHNKLHINCFIVCVCWEIRVLLISFCLFGVQLIDIVPSFCLLLTRYALISGY